MLQRKCREGVGITWGQNAVENRVVREVLTEKMTLGRDRNVDSRIKVHRYQEEEPTLEREQQVQRPCTVVLEGGAVPWALEMYSVL